MKPRGLAPKYGNELEAFKSRRDRTIVVKVAASIEFSSLSWYTLAVTMTRFTCPEQTTELDGSDRQSDCAISAPREKHGIENVGFLDLSEIINIIQPLLVKGPGTGAVSGISIDTRKPIGEDYIFWAIKGRNFNGNDFVEEALNLGVKAAVVSRPDLLEKELAERGDI